MAIPFLKWVGGKRSLLPQITSLFPNKPYRYFEPFLGGGAVALELLGKGIPSETFLSDANSALICTWDTVQLLPDVLVGNLTKMQHEYRLNPEPTFKKWRMEMPKDSLSIASWFIAINRVGFNGLYRLNKKGVCNTPWGRNPLANMIPEEAIREASKVLQHKVHIECSDYKKVLTEAQKGDVVYMDPPYVPVSMTSNFTGYTAGGFSKEDHKDVAETFHTLSRKGVHVVVSNADNETVRELYTGAKFMEVNVRRAINSDATKRGAVGEVLIYS